MDETAMAAVFTEWKKRYDEDPGSFEQWATFVSDPPKDYGEGAARYFLWLAREMEVIG